MPVKNNSLYGRSDTSGTVINVVAVTGSTSTLITGSTSVVNTVLVTGNTTLVGVSAITGNTSVINTVSITGNTSILNTVTITGSVTMIGGGSSVILTDGVDIADVLNLTNYNPLAVAIVDSNGDQIASFGGGTQYTEGDTDATIVGTVAMMEVSANTLQPIQGTIADGILVNLGSNNDVTFSGTVTITGNTTLVGVSSITGSTSVINTVSSNIFVGGSVASTSNPVPIQPPLSGYLVVSGNTSVINVVSITGSTTLVGTSSITGSTSVINTVAITGNTTLVGVSSITGTTTGIFERVSTATLTNVAASTASTQLLASTAGRKGAFFFNDSTASLYLKYGTTASTSSFTVLLRPNDYYELPMPIYTGVLEGIWDATNGNVRITELS